MFQLDTLMFGGTDVWGADFCWGVDLALISGELSF